MDSNFSGAIAKLRGASDDEISMGQRGDLMKPNNSEGIKSKEPKATGVSDKNNKKVAAVASSTSGCQICGHDHQHIRCPYLEVVPPGGTVGPDYLVVCGECGYELKQPIPACCWSCGYFGGRVVGASTFDYSFRYYLDEFYIEEPVTAEYMDPDKYTEQKPEEPVTAEYMDPDKYTEQKPVMAQSSL